MTRFNYKAYDGTGRLVDGAVDAESQGDALGKLHGLGFTPFHAAVETGEKRVSLPVFFTRERGTISLADRARIARQLATLLKAGIALDRALRILELQTPAGKARRLVTAAIEGVSTGQTLSKVFAAGGSGYLADEIGLIKAGEQTGSLAAVLEELAAMLERRLELRGRLISALVYPAILLMTALLSLIVIATVLVPTLLPLFEQSGAEPPLILRILLWFAVLVQDDGMTLVGVTAVLACLLVWVLRRPGAQLAVDGLMLRIPGLRNLTAMTESSRICRTLGSLLRSGVALQHAMTALRDVARNGVSRAQLSQASELIAGGTKLAEALKRVTVLDPTALQMIRIGEETNTLEAMLLHVAQSQETDLARQIERLMTVLTPLLTVALGILFGALIMSVMGAILDLNEFAVR